MGFLDKAEKAMKDHPELVKDVQGLFGDKKTNGASTAGIAQGGSAASTYGGSTTSTYDGSSTTNGSTAAFTPASSIRGPVDTKSLSVPASGLPGAPAKISLADRKKIRDDFESKKPELEAEFTKILGEPWTIHVDTAGVYTYFRPNPSSGNASPGLYILAYFKGALNHLKIFVDKYGPSAAAGINPAAPSHIVTLEPTSKESVKYVDTDFEDGRWRLLFRNTAFGTNAQNVADNIEQVANAASKSGGAAGGISLTAQQNINTQYEPKIDAQLQLARQRLNNPTLVFEPNFATNYATMAAIEASLDRSDSSAEAKLKARWEKAFGEATLSYFAGFVSQLQFQKFDKDDMMQEAFNEAVTSNTVELLVTSALPAGKRNDAIIEHGALVIRTNPENWWTNVNQATDNLDRLL